jgi:hypothetical protein
MMNIQDEADGIVRRFQNLYYDAERPEAAGIAIEMIIDVLENLESNDEIYSTIGKKGVFLHEKIEHLNKLKGLLREVW